MTKKDHRIITVNERGQFTIPKNDREELGTNVFYYIMDGDTITLKPLQTREEFLKELDEAEADWEENGGYTLEEMQKMHDL